MDHEPVAAARAPVLFDLLARSWRLPSAVAAVVPNLERSAVAFACADGSLAIAPMADPEPPESRIRVSTETGQASIRPRRKAVPPPAAVTTAYDGGRPPPMTRHRRSCFAVAGGEGRLLGVTPRGQVVPFAFRLDQPVAALDHHPGTGRIACAGGGELALIDDGDPAAAGAAGAPPLRIEHELPLSGVGFAPDGRRLAATHARGLSLWHLDGATPPRRRDLAFPGSPTGLSWSPDGVWIACPLASEGFQLLRLEDGAGGPVRGYPTPVRSLAWSTAADALATSGAFRALAWSMARPPLDDDVAGAVPAGRPGLVVVESVAAHPRRPLLAVGYANGLVNLVRLGLRDELMVRPDSGGGGSAVTALAWSEEGDRLAIGAADGTAAIVGFPPQLFKQ